MDQRLIFIKIQDIDWLFCPCGELADWYQVLEGGYKRQPLCNTCKEEKENEPSSNPESQPTT